MARLKDVLVLALALAVALGGFWLFETVREDLAFHRAVRQMIEQQMQKAR